MSDSASFADRYAQAAQAMADPELWEASVYYSDGRHMASTDFFLPGGSTEADALNRARMIWNHARANPTLTVKLVAPAIGKAA